MKRILLVSILSISLIGMTAFAATSELDQKQKIEIKKDNVLSDVTSLNVETFTAVIDLPTLSNDLQNDVLIVTNGEFVFSVSRFSFCEDVGWQSNRINYNSKLLKSLSPGLKTEKVDIRNVTEA